MDENFPIPTNEEYRLSVVHDLQILDTPPEPEFDRLTRFASSHFGVPAALLTMMDTSRNWFKSTVGVEFCESSRQHAFCAYAIMQDEPLVILDTHKDPRFAQHALVVNEPHVRFYVGAPLMAAPGVRLGTLCIFGFEPRASFSEEERQMLKDLAAQAMSALIARKSLLQMSERLADVEGGGGGDAAEKARRRVLTIANHELRTPLNAILGFSEIMRGGKMSLNAIEDYANCIFSAGKSLERIIESVLTYSQLETGEVRLNEETFDIFEMITQVEQRVQLLRPNRKLALHVQKNCEDDLLIHADRLHTEQMISQLLDNAIKVTPDGGTVRLSVGLDGEDNLTITVADEGPGLSNPEFKLACQSFQKIGDLNDTRNDGLGIGLCVVTRLVEAHGGRLTLADNDEPGACIEMCLPYFRVRSVGDQSQARMLAS